MRIVGTTKSIPQHHQNPPKARREQSNTIASLQIQQYISQEQLQTSILIGEQQ